MRLKCLFGRHERSAGLAREYERKMYSVCRHCATPLIQGRDRIWRPMTPEQKIEMEAAKRQHDRDQL
ncbi:hypothetical protein [Flavisphingomonas formosensis]|uniref:hypothetical protein n=1 Tax=Flavisphingomonas formosensis TaxID=861534 RepID=UPI0012FB282E|nr:hypothetical protein [Sphingomonas formosensis]